jgi:hypothetical protein
MDNPDDTPDELIDNTVFKDTKTIIEARCVELLRIRLDGAQYHDIVDFVAEKIKTGEPPWKLRPGQTGLSRRQIWRYLRRCDAMLEKHFEKNRSRLMRKAISQRDNIVARAIAAGDNRTALAAMDSRDRLFGLFPDLAVPVTSTLPHAEMQQILKQPDTAQLLLALSERLVAASQPPKQVEAIVVDGSTPPAEQPPAPSPPPDPPPPEPPRLTAQMPPPGFNVFDGGDNEPYQDGMTRRMNQTYGR